MDPRANGRHVLDKVDNNTRQDTHIGKEQEQEHQNEGASYSPCRGEQKVTGPVINGTGQLVMVLIKHGNEPC